VSGNNIRGLNTNHPGTFHNRRFGHDARTHGLDLLGYNLFRFLGGSLVFFGSLALDFAFGGRLRGGSFLLDLGNGFNGLGRRLVDRDDFLDRYYGRGLSNFSIRSFGDDLLRLGDKFFGGFFGRRLFHQGLLAFAYCLFGLFMGSNEVHVLSGLYGAPACGRLAKPLRNSRSQTGFDRGHVVLDLDALGAAFFQNDLAGNAEFLG
jgi:hypothetical protein